MARVPLIPISQSASRSAARGIGQRQHFMVGAQMGEAVADRPVLVIDLATTGGGWASAWRPGRAAPHSGRSARPSRPASQALTQAGDILALDQAGQQTQAFLRPLDGIQREMRRNHRQVGKTPLAALDVVFSGTVSSSRWPMAEDNT